MSIHRHRLVLLAALLAAVSLLPACDDSPTEPGDVRLSFETVAVASYSGFTESQRLVIRDAGQWPGIWETLHAGQSPAPSRPAIDFDRQMVVLVALGGRPNGCFAVEVTDITLRGPAQIRIGVAETEPGGTCGCTDALTQPVHVVSLARIDRSEEFQARRQQRNC